MIQLRTLTQQWQPQIDPDLLSTAIDECVKHGQKRLRQEFDYRRKMLELDAHDRYLINEFYNLAPNDEQVCASQQTDPKLFIVTILFLTFFCFRYDLHR